MTDNDRKYAIECVDYQLENGYLDFGCGCHDQDELEVVREAMCALKVLEQIRWERDITISQLEELGLSLGQGVDHVKNAIEFTEKVKELWKDYMSKSNTVDLVKGLDELIGN